MPNRAAKPTYTYLIWCETDGGCPNPVVARYLFITRFETLSPNRPATQSKFIPKITILPPSKCIANKMPATIRSFISGKLNGISTPAGPFPDNCKKCKLNKDCESRLCVSKRCVRSLNTDDVRSCFSRPKPVPERGGNCNGAQRISACVSGCLSNAW